MTTPELRRWAYRQGLVVEWGNFIGPYIGQHVKETFATDAEARERETQVLAYEPISPERSPRALTRETC